MKPTVEWYKRMNLSLNEFIIESRRFRKAKPTKDNSDINRLIETISLTLQIKTKEG